MTDQTTSAAHNIDPYTPAQIADRIESGGVVKAALDAPRMLVLAVLAGAFIGLGGLASTVAGTVPGLGVGPARLLMGVAFSLGLLLVVVAGAELFTGNNLIVMAWASRRVKTAALLRNWVIVYAGNFIGASLTAGGVYLSGVHGLADGEAGRTLLATVATKSSLGWTEAFVRGVFGNALVCLAIWLTFAARTVIDKVACILFPVAAFVAVGFEHSVANMYYYPLAMLLEGTQGTVTWGGFLVGNLVPVTLGNIIGGSVLVALVYWFVYLRGESAGHSPGDTGRSGGQ